MCREVQNGGRGDDAKRERTRELQQRVGTVVAHVSERANSLCVAAGEKNREKHLNASVHN